MLHDKYDIDIEQAVRLIPYDGRDNDESGAGMFWDLAGKVANDLQYYKLEERQELLYNAFHKIREATLELNPKKALYKFYDFEGNFIEQVEAESHEDALATAENRYLDKETPFKVSTL